MNNATTNNNPSTNTPSSTIGWTAAEMDQHAASFPGDFGEDREELAMMDRRDGLIRLADRRWRLEHRR